MKLKLTALILALVASLTATVSAKDDSRETVTFLVSMTCGGCKSRIEKRLTYETGVTDLEVSLKKKTVTVEYDPSKTTPETLKAAITGLGYTATVFKQRAAASGE